MTPWGDAQRASARRVSTRMGAPPTVRYCLGWRIPMREPEPPAGTTATAFVIEEWSPRAAPSSSRDSLVFLEPGEDHAARGGLEHRGDAGADLLADEALAVIHNHHGAVVEVGHPLASLLALLDDVDLHHLARKHHGLEGVGQLVDVEHRHAGELGHPVEVVVVGDDLAPQDFPQLDELSIHLAHMREVTLLDPHRGAGDALEALEHVEPAFPPVALERIGSVRDLLE